MLLGGTNSASVIEPDEAFDREVLQPLRAPLETYMTTIVGVSEIDILRDGSKSRETSLGNLACDAAMWFMRERMPASFANLTMGGVDACLLNGGKEPATVGRGGGRRKGEGGSGKGEKEDEDHIRQLSPSMPLPFIYIYIYIYISRGTTRIHRGRQRNSE